MTAHSAEINLALNTLNKEGVLLYPTDTIWGIGCDARSSKAVEAIYALKKREDSKALICLVASQEMLERYVGDVPKVLLNQLKVARPTTVIYPAVKGVSERLCAVDGSIGIRIVQDAFCQALIEKLGAPLVSTSANISGQPSAQHYKEITPEILNGVDHIVPLRQNKTQQKASRIIRLKADNSIELLRD